MTQVGTIKSAMPSSVGGARVPDLLSLIGNAIEKLGKSVELFEASRQSDGLDELSSVIAEIDGYVLRIDEDPLLKLSPVDRTQLVERLGNVKQELQAVIDRFSTALS
jgi:hypothetical protein